MLEVGILITFSISQTPHAFFLTYITVRKLGVQALAAGQAFNASMGRNFTDVPRRTFVI